MGDSKIAEARPKSKTSAARTTLNHIPPREVVVYGRLRKIGDGKMVGVVFTGS